MTPVPATDLPANLVPASDLPSMGNSPTAPNAQSVESTPIGPKDVPGDVPQPKPQPGPSAMDLIRGVPEALAGMGQGTLAQLAGRATALFNGPAGLKVASAMSPEVSERGKAVLDKIDSWLQKSKLEGMGPMAMPEGQAATKVLRGRAVPENVAAANKSGFALTPTEGKGGVVSRLAESLSGEAKLAKGVSADNIPVANAKIAADLGLPKGSRLTPENLAQVESEAWAKYDAVRKVGRIQTDAAYTAALDKLGETYKSASSDFPELARSDVEDVVKGLKKGSFDSSAGVDMIRQLRESANQAYVNGNGGLARVLRGGAKAIEDQIDRHLSDGMTSGETVSEFRRARTTLAKVHEARKSLAGGENINPQTYAKQLVKNPELLTGAGREIGQAAKDFPRSMQKSPVGNYQMPAWGDLIMGVLGGGGSALHGGLSPATAIPTAAAIAARPATRAFLASRPYQKWQATHPQVQVPVPSPQSLQALGVAPMLPQRQQ